MLADDIAAALPELRAQAESMMVDTCLIADPNVEAAWDAENGVWSTPEGAALYSGKCRIRQPSAGTAAEAGEAAFAISDRIVSIPLSGEGYSEGVDRIPVGASVTITSATGDPFLRGKTLTYLSPASEQTYPTARRMLCRKVD